MCIIEYDFQYNSSQKHKHLNITKKKKMSNQKINQLKKKKKFFSCFVKNVNKSNLIKSTKKKKNIRIINQKKKKKKPR